MSFFFWGGGWCSLRNNDLAILPGDQAGIMFYGPFKVIPIEKKLFHVIMCVYKCLCFCIAECVVVCVCVCVCVCVT